MYALSVNGRHILKNLEGLRLEAYADAVGKQTIGYGHLMAPGEKKQISMDEANTLFMHDLQRFVDELNRDCLLSIDTHPNQNQFDALVIFMYNVGIGAWHGSTARHFFLDGKYAFIPKELLKWVHDSYGHVIPGLSNRRNNEILLFNLPI